jgi:hypothetical protein
VFLPEDLGQRLIQAGSEILNQLRNPDRLRGMMAAIPGRWNAPGMSSLPSFTQIDFAIVRDEDGCLSPRLIELQGFPSLTAMQVIARDVWDEILREIPGLHGDWSCWFSGLDRDSFLALARQTITGGHDPEEVVLMDIDPSRQKTYPDFAATRLLFGVDSICPTMMVKQGRTLWRRGPQGKGRLIPIRRIYNRVVFDELVRKKVGLPFDYRDELQVEWAPHPNWFWVWSKFSLPFLDHPAVPKATLLSDLDRTPEDLENYVLKPLFSFAGGGVNIAPTKDDFVRIPEAERRAWCLQKKIDYEPALRAVDGGGVKVEIRLMFLKPDDADRPVLAQNLCRLSRGAMMGVDFNRESDWVGSSVALRRA